MNNKYLLGTAVAAALMFGAQAASACAISAWSSATGLTVADTGEPPAGFKRYSGRCSLQVPNASTPRFVTDTTPNNEASYRVRFYYYTGNLTGATADIFQARNTGGTNIIRVTHDGNALSFTTTSGAAQTVTVVDNRYYSIELAWAAGAGTGSLTGTVTGNSGGAVTAAVAGTVNFPNLSNAADSITEARLGLISGAPTVASTVYFDEFDSRRTQNPGRLCRGDVGGGAGGATDGNINVSDRVVITNEILETAVALGAPDVTEDGLVNVSDRVAVTNLILDGASCN
jgi:hypothetical protein